MVFQDNFESVIYLKHTLVQNYASLLIISFTFNNKLLSGDIMKEES